MAGLGGLTNGLGGGGGPLGAASGLTGSATNAVPGLGGGAGGGPLGAASGLTGAVPGLGAGDGGGLTDGITGLTSGLLGGGQGLNLLNLVGVGSDDDALLNLNPAEHKKVKAAKEAQARQNQKKRDAAMRQMQEQIQKQGGKPTADQEQFMRELRESEAKDKQDLDRAEQILGPTDPQEFQKAMAESDAAEASRATQRAQNSASSSNGSAATGGSGAQPAGPSDGLFYAYLVDSNTHTPTHTLTFANAAAADEWFRQVSATSSVQRVSPQMYMYSGVAPRPSGRMACMPNTSSAPVLPLQRADGYPICCKSGPSTAGTPANPATSTNTATNSNPYTQQAAAPPAPPPRQRFTFNDAAKAQAQSAKQNGDPRPMAEIYQEAMRDLKEDCPKQSGGPAFSSQTGPGATNTMTNGSAPYAANGTSSNTFPGAYSNTMPNGTGNNMTNGAPGNAIQPPADNSGSDALNALGLGGLTSGLLGGGPGLNVAGILAIGKSSTKNCFRTNLCPC